MKFKTIFSKTLKVISALALVGILGSQVISAPKQSSATGPQFNFLENDRELFSGLNHTKNEQVYTDPVTSNGNDEVAALVYYHNGIVNTVAENTKINVTMPTITNQKAKVLKARLSADNAEAVTDTIVNGQIVGKSGLTINTPSTDSTVSFEPGSVRWFPEGSANPVALPGGQTGDDIITSQGVSIGDIKGCWQYSGYLAFKLIIKTPEQPKPAHLLLEKTVKNARIESQFVKSDEAIPGDELTYKIKIMNDGQSASNPLVVRDLLPPKTTFVNGSLLYFPDGSATAVALPNGQTGDFVIGNGVNFASLVNGNHQIVLTFRAKIDNSGLTNDQILVNTAKVNSDNKELTDTAQTKIKIETPPVAAPKFTLSKSAFNLTQNVDGQSVIANPGDVIRYNLTTKNIGNGAGTVTVSDGIADILEYGNVVDNGGGLIQNQPSDPSDDNKTIIKYSAKNLNPGQEVINTFTIKVKSPLPTNAKVGNHFDLTLFNFYGNQVIIHVKPPVPPVVVPPSISIDKKVRDLTLNESTFVDEDKAYSGDTVEYQIIVSNTGGSVAKGIKLIDTLPANTAYIAGSAKINANGIVTALNDSVVTSGTALPDLAANSNYMVTLKAKIDGGVAASACLVNSAYATLGNQNPFDKATTCILANPVIVASAPQTPVKTVSAPNNLPRTGDGSLYASIFGGVFTVSNLLYLTGKKKISHFIALNVN